MIPWIQVYSNLITHPKTSRLADQLKLSNKATVPNVVATGLLISLWTWAIQNAYSGDLSGCSDRAIAEAARYKLNPCVFVKALTDAGWLDPDRRLHDWDQYASLLIEQEDNRRSKTKERVKRYRDKKKSKEDTRSSVTSPQTTTQSGSTAPVTCNASVTVTRNKCNASTIPNHTIPYIPVSAYNTTPDTEALQQAQSVHFDGQAFSAFWEDYPTKYGQKEGREAAWQAWRKLAPDAALAARIISNLKAWKISGEWIDDGDRYIPKASDFLSKKMYWDTAPVPSKHYAIPRGASGELGEAELEAIRSVLNQPNREGGAQNA